MKKKAILWDNDGVLSDTERLFYQVNRDFFRGLGLDLSIELYVQLFLEANCGVWHMLNLPEERIRSLRDERNQIYNQTLLEIHDPYVPGIADVLERLVPKFRMGVVTSARRVDFMAIHRDGRLLDHFEFVVTEEDYLNPKPEPDPYLLGLFKLGLQAEEVVVVEDTPRGLRSARQAGIDCIIIQNELTKHCTFEGNFQIVATPHELLDVMSEFS